MTSIRVDFGCAETHLLNAGLPLMPGWSNRGNAKPGWMGCEHVAGPDGRCTGCNAIQVDGFQQNLHVGRGAVGLAEMEPVMARAISPSKGDGTAPPFNQPINRK